MFKPSTLLFGKTGTMAKVIGDPAMAQISLLIYADINVFDGQNCCNVTHMYFKCHVWALYTSSLFIMLALLTDWAVNDQFATVPESTIYLATRVNSTGPWHGQTQAE